MRILFNRNWNRKIESGPRTRDQGQRFQGLEHKDSGLRTWGQRLRTKDFLTCRFKFSYLQSLLLADAQDCIKGISLTEDNYTNAKQMLLERFGRKETIIFGHIQKLLTISHDGSNNLWKLYDEIQANVRSLDGFQSTAIMLELS